MNKDFKRNFKSLMDLSAPDEQEQKTFGKHPVLEGYPDTGSLKGVDFDTIREIWYPSQPDKNVPCSVDALIFRNDKIYLVEFKSGKLAHLERKIYDSIMMLIEHDNQDFKTLRQTAIYIVVAPKFRDSPNRDKVVLRSTLYSSKVPANKPWDNPYFVKLNDRWNLRSLEGVIVAKTYCLPPSMFDEFVKVEGLLFSPLA